MWTWRHRTAEDRATVDQLVRCLNPGVEPAPEQVRTCGEGVDVQVLPDDAPTSRYDNRRPLRFVRRGI